MATARQRLRLSTGTELAFITAGDADRPALLLIHGFPSSSRTFRNVIPKLAKHAFVVAPDLPGFGESDVLPATSFNALTDAVRELLDSLGVGPRFIYLHDYGAPIGMQLAMEVPELVLGLIIQNANAHRTGFGPSWADTLAFWARPDAKNEAFEGVRNQYILGVPDDIVRQIRPQVWEEDWRVVGLPGRMAMHRSLVADYGSYVARFDAIAGYLAQRQPPALMVWGRHDAFFDIAESLSWVQDLPRMEAHILDGGHFLLETEAPRAAALVGAFIARQLG
jgi:pimeloyl-ACP methyl ester carboxylesterase